MEKDEPKSSWANHTMDWTKGVPSCSKKEESLQIVYQAGGDISGEDIAK